MKRPLIIAILCLVAQFAMSQQSIDQIVDQKVKAGMEEAVRRSKAYTDSVFKGYKPDVPDTTKPDTRPICSEIGRDPKIMAISSVKSNALTLQFDANNVIELQYDIIGSSGATIFTGTRAPASPFVELTYPAQPNGSYTLKIRGYSCKSPDDSKPFEITTDQGGGNPPPSDKKYIRQIIMQTTGSGFNASAEHGIDDSWIERIEATKFTDGSGYGISGVCAWIPWDGYEKTKGVYEEAALRRLVKYCRDRGLTLSAAFMRRRHKGESYITKDAGGRQTTDYFIRDNEIITGSNGTQYIEGVPSNPAIYAGYANDRVNDLSSGAIKSIVRILSEYDKSFYIGLVGGGAGEQVNYVFNGRDFREAGDHSQDNLDRFYKWAAPRKIAKRLSGSIPMVQGAGNDWPHPDFKDPDSVGIEFARFTTYGIAKAFNSFVDAAKSENANIPCIYLYSVAANLQLRSIANPNMNYIAQRGDGMYGSDGDGIHDQQGKDRVNSLNLGTFPTKISMAEEDPDDVSLYDGPSATPPLDNGNLQYHVFESTARRLFARGLMVMNLAMAWGVNELRDMHPTFKSLKKDYVGHEYTWPNVNSSNTKTVNVTEKYRNSINLMEGIDPTVYYVKYTDQDFWGGVSPEVGDGGGTASQPSADYTPVESYLKGNINNYNGNIVFDLKSTSATLHSFQTGAYNKNSRLKVMSHSKFTTGVIISYLIDKGTLSLDTKVGDVISSWKKAGRGDITVRQIMGHLSGIPDNTDNEGVETLEYYVDELVKKPGFTTPGERFIYSTTAYQVIARMAEIKTGKPWRDLFRDILVNPCEMGAAEYNPTIGDIQGKPFNPLAGYGLVCSASEWMNFIGMIRDGGVFKGKRVLSASVIEILKTQTSPGWSDWGVGVMWRDGQFISEAASGCFTFILPGHYAGTIFTQSSYEATYTSNHHSKEMVWSIYQQSK